ncbi:MAG: BON domain-containing protein [Candidatus Binataceae bacterium]
MEVREKVLGEVRAALEHEPRINLHRFPLAFELGDDGTLVLEGEAGNIAAKKLALELAASVPGVTGVVDRVRVAPARRMGDGQIRDHVRDALLEEAAFENFGIRVQAGNQWETVREPISVAASSIAVSVNDGVVTLNGLASSVSHKSLAGALAWWVPGSRDVINGIEISPPQEESDDEITEAVHLVLEKDPLINADTIRVGTRNAVVTLEGTAPSDSQKEMAEMDAWYVFGVDRVINRLKVRQ